MFCTENKQTRGGSRTPRSSMMELFVTMEVISYWQSSFNLDDRGIVELPLYAFIFSFQDKIGIMEEDKDQENSSISHTGTFFLFSLRGIYFFASSAEKHWFFDRFICILAFLLALILAFSYFENIQITCKSTQSTKIFHFETWNLFSHPFWLKKLFPSSKVEVNKPDLRRIYLHIAPD